MAEVRLAEQCEIRRYCGTDEDGLRNDAHSISGVCIFAAILSMLIIPFMMSVVGIACLRFFVLKDEAAFDFVFKYHFYAVIFSWFVLAYLACFAFIAIMKDRIPDRNIRGMRQYMDDVMKGKT